MGKKNDNGKNAPGRPAGSEARSRGEIVRERLVPAARGFERGLKVLVNLQGQMAVRTDQDAVDAFNAVRSGLMDRMEAIKPMEYVNPDTLPKTAQTRGSGGFDSSNWGL